MVIVERRNRLSDLYAGEFERKFVYEGNGKV